MGLMDLLFGPVEAPEPKPDRPETIRVEPAAGTVYATSSGQLITMEDLPDPVFAAGVMGPCVGIKPREGVVYAPVGGVVTLTTNTLHALGLRSDDGIEVLIHVGVDTVNMRGDGFYGFVAEGQRVVAGEPLVVMNLDKIAAAGYSDVVISVVTNSDDFPDPMIALPGRVEAGQTVMSFDAAAASADA